LLAAAPAPAAPPPGESDKLKFFEERVRPVLAANCLQCHGPRKQRGHLRLDSRAALLQGGDTGPAVVPGKPDDSLIIQAVRHSEQLKMPPKRKLPPRVIADLAAWVRMGSPWPKDAPQWAASAEASQPGSSEEAKF